MDRELSYCFSISRPESLPKRSFAIHDILGLGEKDAKSKAESILQEDPRAYCTNVSTALELIPDKFSGKLLRYISEQWRTGNIILKYVSISEKTTAKYCEICE